MRPATTAVLALAVFYSPILVLWTLIARAADDRITYLVIPAVLIASALTGHTVAIVLYEVAAATVLGQLTKRARTEGVNDVYEPAVALAALAASIYLAAA